MGEYHESPFNANKRNIIELTLSLAVSTIAIFYRAKSNGEWSRTVTNVSICDVAIISSCSSEACVDVSGSSNDSSRLWVRLSGSNVSGKTEIKTVNYFYFSIIRMPVLLR